MTYYVLDANTGKPVPMNAAEALDGTQLLYVADAEMAASISGRAFRKYVVDKTPGTTEALVLTDAGIVYNIPEGRRVLITCIFIGVETLSDSCRFSVGKCNLVDGGGTFTPVSIPVLLATGNVQSSRDIEEYDMHPPIAVGYSATAKSVTMRVIANDTGCVVTCGYAGWLCRFAADGT